MNLGDSFRE